MIDTWKKYEFDTEEKMVECVEKANSNNTLNNCFSIGQADNGKWMLDVVYIDVDQILSEYDEYIVQPTNVLLEQIDDYKWN